MAYCFLCHTKMHDKIFAPTSCLCLTLLTQDEQPVLLGNLVSEFKEARIPFKKYNGNVPEKNCFSFCSYCADVFFIVCNLANFRPKCPICQVAFDKIAIFEDNLCDFLYDDLVAPVEKQYAKIRPILNKLYSEWDKKTDIDFADLVNKEL